jgi:hypothetical protein
VQRITDVDDFYGILVRIKHKRGTSDFPLCDLAASDKASSNGLFKIMPFGLPTVSATYAGFPSEEQK